MIEGFERHPPGALPPTTISCGGEVLRKNRTIAAGPALRLSGSGVPRVLLSFEDSTSLSHAQLAEELSRRPTEDTPEELSENLLYVFGHRTKAGDTRLIVFCVNET